MTARLFAEPCAGGWSVAAFPNVVFLTKRSAVRAIRQLPKPIIVAEIADAIFELRSLFEAGSAPSEKTISG